MKENDWIEKASLEELVDQVIWESIMQGTAFCGWTDRARSNLVKNTQEVVKWAIEKKTKKRDENEF